MPSSVPHKPALDHLDHMGDAVPFADQPRARLERGRRFTVAVIAIGRAVGDHPQPAVGRRLETAISPRLHLVGDGPDEKTPTDALGGSVR